jgi:hypothetical protein
MIKKIFVAIFLIFNLLIILYLISPVPQLVDLPHSIRSQEPGDTIELKNVSAYYTNLSRTEVINFYKANLNGPFRIQLNHPPEKSKDIIRDTIQSYYLEEFVFPFKESVFINGYEWANDVFTKPEKRIVNKLLYENKEYSAKITIKIIPTNLPCRLIAFVVSEIDLIAIFYLYRQVFFKKNK